MSNKSVLFVVTRGIVGGVSSALLPLATELKKNGVHVEFGIGSGEYLAKEASKIPAPVTRFRFLKRSLNPLTNFLFSFELFFFVRRHKFSAVHLNSSNSLFGALLLRMVGVKTIFVVHGLSFLDRNHSNALVRGFYWVVYKVLLLFPSLIVFVSSSNLRRALTLHLCSSRKSVYIPNAIVEPEFFAPDFARQKLEHMCGVSLAGKKVLGSIGRLAYPKNYEFVISAMPAILKRDSSFIFVLIGEGPERAKYETLIEELSLKNSVFLLGEVEGASQYLQGFDIFTLPSIYEGMSIVLIEAVLAEVPVVASEVGGNSEIVGKDCTFPSGDEGAFVSSVFSAKLADNRLLPLEEVAHEYLSRI